MTSEAITTFVDQHETGIDRWRKSLVHKDRDTKELPDSEQLGRQRTLLRDALDSSGALARNLRQGLGIGQANLNEFPSLTKPIATAELKNLQVETALRLHTDMTKSGCTRRHASNGSYWLLCIIHWLEQDLLDDPPAPAFIFKSIQAEWLADDFELTDKDGPNQGKHIDNRIRDLLRRLGGIPHVRDRTAFRTDCSLAHLWWATELSNAIAEIDGITFTRDEALEFLLTRVIMEEVTRWVARRTGRLAQPLALASALEASINREQDNNTHADEDNTTKINVRKLRQKMERLARRSRYWRMDHNSPLTVQNLAQLCNE